MRPQMWFNLDIKRAKRQARKKEKIWRLDPGEHTWSVYKEHRRIYYQLIKMEKRRVLSASIMATKYDTRKLYGIVKNLMGTRKQNPLPEALSHQELAESFSSSWRK